MENAVEALYIGFAILVFVIAVSITMSSFSLVRQVSTSIIDNIDSETKYTYSYGTANGNGEGALQTKRIVGKETIIPTLYRSYIENYEVRFFDSKNNPINIFQVYDESKGEFVSTNRVALNDGGIGNHEQAKQFVNNLVSGKLEDLLLDGKNKGLYTNFKVSEEDLHGNKFHGIIVDGNGKFVETLGIYYYEDKRANATEDINKTEKRVITYTQVN